MKGNPSNEAPTYQRYLMSFVMDVLRPWIPARPKSPCAGNGNVASMADQIFRSSERSECFPTILFLYSLGICRQSSSGLCLFVKEAVCVDAAIRHQGEMFIWSKENDMAYDSKYLDRMLQLHGGNLQPSWRTCRSRKRTHNKDKIWCCGCGEYFYLSVYWLNKMVA